MTQLTERAAGPNAVDAARSARIVMIIVCAGVVLASVDLFIVNVALPQIARDFGATDLGSLSWVLNGYAIVYASLLVFFGRLADRYRRDRGFLLGVAIFTAASIACAASTSVAMLVAFRLVQAAGAALLTPTSLGLVLAVSAPDRRPSAVRAWTAVGGAAAAVGPVVGGLLVAVDWRWVFLVNVPIGVVALIAGWRYLPLRDDIASTALFYLDRPTARRPRTPTADDMEVHLGTAPVPDIGATPPRAPRD
ncbi:MAG: MFS transporter [Microbacterium sp.]|nr:MFS transporter [Microbacterium sp.]